MNMVEIVQLSFSHSSLIINIILITAFILNLIFAFIIIFMERRSAGSIWAWLFSSFISTNSRIYFISIIRASNTTQTYF